METEQNLDPLPVWNSGTLLISAISPINIALVKYWGKVDCSLIIPLNSSISMTLSPQDLCSTTTVYLSKDLKENTLELNGEVEKFSSRINKMIAVIKAQAQGVRAVDSSNGEEVLISKEELLDPDMKIRVVSVNNFPTASGVASSSSGLSCLAMCLAKIYGCELDRMEISRLARMGSGSACRSLFGGFVMWERGFSNFDEVENEKEKVDLKSTAIQLFDEHHWPDLCCVICVADDRRKDVPSTDGMQRTVETSELLKWREKHVVPTHIEKLKIALSNKNWSDLTTIIMKESNSLHSVCLDTYPPIFYMNETTKSIISLVHELNENHSEPLAAYTVDAGANCFLITKQAYVETLLCLLKSLSNLTNNENNNCSLIESKNFEEFSPTQEFKDKIISKYSERIQLS